MSNALTTKKAIAAAEIFALLMCTVASPGSDPDPDPNPNSRGGGQLPNPNKYNSTLTSRTGEEALIGIKKFILLEELCHRCDWQTVVSKIT